jgi:hypothetical protein
MHLLEIDRSRILLWNTLIGKLYLLPIFYRINKNQILRAKKQQRLICHLNIGFLLS